MKFKKMVKCKVCGQPIVLPGGVIEYNPKGEMRICHKECSIGFNIPGVQISDFEIGGVLAPDEDAVYDHLEEIGKVYPDCFWACKEMKDILFE